MYTLIDDYDIAEEGLFGPTKVSKLLSIAEKNLKKKLRTPEDCDAYLQKVQRESTIFNDALGTMAEAAREYNAGNLEKGEFKAKIKAAQATIKSEATMLKLSDINKNAKNVTDEEIANMRAYIIGVSDLIRNRKNALTNSLSGSIGAEAFSTADDVDDMVPGDTIVMEGSLYRMNHDYELEVVEEGIFSKMAAKKAIRGDVRGMSLDDCLPLYAAYLQEKYGSSLINDKSVYSNYASDGGKVVKYGGQHFVKKTGAKGTTLAYAISSKNGTPKFNMAAESKVRAKVIKELSIQKAAADKTENLKNATEALAEFLIISNQADDYMDAYDAIESAFGLTEESFEIADEAFDGIKNMRARRKAGKAYSGNIKSLAKEASALMKSSKVPKSKKSSPSVDACRQAMADLREAKKIWAKCSKLANYGQGGENIPSNYYDTKMSTCDDMIESWKSLMDSAKAAAKGGRSGASEGLLGYIDSDDFDYMMSPADESYYDSILGIDSNYYDDIVYEY